MKVSPHWRNTILHCPMLWNTIVVAPSWNKLQLKAHVERSWPSLVDIEICGWWITDSDLNLNELLDVAALCADRWRSVSILNTDFPRIAVLRSIRHLVLPSLARFSVACIPAFLDENSDIFNPRFFTPGNSPFLQYLEIGGDFITSPGLPILPSLKELHICLPPYTSGTSTTFLERLSLYPRLSTLTLSGDDQALKLLRPNGLQLPFLGKLICKLSNASSLLHAIVAPMLTHFEYTPEQWGRLDGDILFTGIGSKFTGVRHLVLNTKYRQFKKVVWSAFPNLCHVELHRHDADIIFQSDLPSIAWQYLESLFINGGHALDDEGVHIHGSPTFLDGLANWLQQRRDMGKSMLQIKIFSYSGDADWISKMHDELHALSMLEWGDNMFNMFVRLSGTSATPWLDMVYYMCLLASQLFSASHFWRAVSRKASSKA